MNDIFVKWQGSNFPAGSCPMNKQKWIINNLNIRESEVNRSTPKILNGDHKFSLSTVAIALRASQKSKVKSQKLTHP